MKRKASRLFLDFLAVVHGISLSFICLGILAIVFGTLGFFIHALEGQAGLLVVVAGLSATCFGGAAAARRARNMGWLHGGLVGLGFIISSYLIGLFIPTESGPATNVLLHRLFWGMAMGALGGMMGVNL